MRDRQSVAELSDAALVERACGGGGEGFEQLVLRYQAARGRVARSRLGRADWAEDVVQETFLAVYRGLASYDPRFAFRTWLWTILLNQCRAHHQRRSRSVPTEPWPVAAESQVAAAEQTLDSSPLSALLARERADELEALLRRLSEAQADALRLRFFGGLKFQEIADAMECSLNTAKARVRVGLMRMAEMLHETAGKASARAGETGSD